VTTVGFSLGIRTTHSTATLTNAQQPLKRIPSLDFRAIEVDKIAQTCCKTFRSPRRNQSRLLFKAADLVPGIYILGNSCVALPGYGTNKQSQPLREISAQPGGRYNNCRWREPPNIV